TSASSSNPSNELESSFSTCFQDSYFTSKRVWEAWKIDIAMLEAILFAYLPILQNWGWMDFLNISLPTYLNLVRAFFSNAKLEHDEFDNIVTTIPSFLIGTPIHLTLDEKGHFDPSFFIQQLGINTHGDTPVSSNQPIIYGALHHAATNTWMKHDHPTDNEDDGVDIGLDDIQVPYPIAPPASSLHAAQPFSEVNSVVLDAIHSLSNDI
ncbi:hypothetical protein Goklo_006495, partial [Gossypium klotzschianum]|nr:hypothetical protein [Gossypium klotzschianum]